MKKTNLKLLALGSALTMLAACGGGSGSDTKESDNGISQPPQTVTQSFSGKAADGYLVDAQVFIDLNQNLLLDSGEPEVVTDETGTYEFTDIEESFDLEAAKLVVNALAGQTIDLDTGTAVETGFVLTAPVGHLDFVSPLTTIIDVQVLNSYRDISDANAELSGLMGFGGSDSFDFLADYIANSSSEDDALAENSKKAHLLAQIITHIAGRNIESINNSALSYENIQVVHAVNDNIYSNIEELVNITESVFAAQDSVNALTEALEQVASLALSSEEMEAKLAELEERKNITKTALSAELSDSLGVYFLEGHRSNTLIDNQCYNEYELERINLSLNDNDALGYVEQAMQRSSLTFIDQTVSYSEVAVLSSGGWALEAEQDVIFQRFTADNSMDIFIPNEGSKSLQFLEKSLDGVALDDLEGVNTNWTAALNEATTFAGGDKAFFVTLTQNDDYIAVPTNFNCAVELDECNVVHAPNQQIVLTDIAQLFENEVIIEMPEQALVSNYVKLEGDETFGRVMLQAGSSSTLIGYYKGQEVDGEQIISLDVANQYKKWIEDDTASLIITKYDNKLRWGYWIKEGAVQREQLALNSDAMTSLMQSIEANNLLEMIDNSNCPDYEPPVVITDEEYITDISGRTYIVERGDEESILKFESDMTLAVEVGSDASGSLSVDSFTGQWSVVNGELVIAYSDVSITEMISDFDKYYFIKTSANEVETLYKRLAQTPVSDSAEVTLELVSDDDAMCEATIHISPFTLFESQGYVEAGTCGSVFGVDNNTNAEMLFKLSQQQLVFNMVDSNGVSQVDGVIYKSLLNGNESYVIKHLVPDNDGGYSHIWTHFTEK